MIDSSVADNIQHCAINLISDLKDNHEFIFDSDYKMLMALLYEVIDKIDDFI